MLTSGLPIHFGQTLKKSKNQSWKEKSDYYSKLDKEITHGDKFNIASQTSNKSKPKNWTLWGYTPPDVKDKLNQQSNKSDANEIPKDIPENKLPIKQNNTKRYLSTPNGKMLEISYPYNENGKPGTKFMSEKELLKIQSQKAKTQDQDLTQTPTSNIPATLNGQAYQSSPNGAPAEKKKSWWGLF